MEMSVCVNMVLYSSMFKLQNTNFTLIVPSARVQSASHTAPPMTAAASCITGAIIITMIMHDITDHTLQRLLLRLWPGQDHDPEGRQQLQPGRLHDEAHRR